MKQIDVLGTTYTIEHLSESEDKELEGLGGYCERHEKRIVICSDKREEMSEVSFTNCQKQYLRHEIIHAFFIESGLQENFANHQFGISETIVDWFAIQGPKIFKVFAELEII